MAYHGYVKFISNYCQAIKNGKQSPVKILEIGVDTGISLFALNNNLNMLNVSFEYTGIDIKIQPHIEVLNWAFFQSSKENKINLVEKNSLDFLKEDNSVYDVIMIDGDHNYETVAKECSYLRKISHKNTVFVFDDYEGKFSYEDQFYYNSKGYENNNLIQIKESSSEKRGVKTAVDEFIFQDGNLKTFKLMKGEPIVAIDVNNDVIKVDN